MLLPEPFLQYQNSFFHNLSITRTTTSSLNLCATQELPPLPPPGRGGRRRQGRGSSSSSSAHTPSQGALSQRATGRVWRLQYYKEGRQGKVMSRSMQHVA